MAREVGTEGKLGGQAQVPGVAGTWKDLTDYGQLDGVEPDRPGAQHRRRRRPRSRRATCRRKITVDVKGEILAAEEHASTPWWTSSTASPRR